MASLFEGWGENLAIGFKLPLFWAFSISILGLSKPFEVGSEIPVTVAFQHSAIGSSDLARISHGWPTAAADSRTSAALPRVWLLNGLSSYASGAKPSDALHLHDSPPPRYGNP